MGAERIRAGLAERMLCGGAEVREPYIWAGFDAMRVLSRKHNDTPEARLAADECQRGRLHPRSRRGGALLESLDAAQARGARIHAEVLGAATNCGGHRGGGSMTAPNPEGVRRCIRRRSRTRRSIPLKSMRSAGTSPQPVPIRARSLRGPRRSVAGPRSFPWITSTKSLDRPRARRRRSDRIRRLRC